MVCGRPVDAAVRQFLSRPHDHLSGGRADEGGPRRQRHPDQPAAGARVRTVLQRARNSLRPLRRPLVTSMDHRCRCDRMGGHGESVWCRAELCSAVRRAYGSRRRRGLVHARGVLDGQRLLPARQAGPCLCGADAGGADRHGRRVHRGRCDRHLRHNRRQCDVASARRGEVVAARVPDHGPAGHSPRDLGAADAA
jgi:hypothetical protein